MRSRFPLTVVTILSAVALSGAAPAPTAVDELAGLDFADPFILRDGDTYWAFATTGLGKNIQVAHSTDLVTWKAAADALPVLPAWADRADGFTWAPSVLHRGAKYVLYYTTRDATSGFQCISRAVSALPEGPYVDDSRRPFVCQVEGDNSFCGSIDPSPFVDEAGHAYLLWKSDENAARCRRSARIWSQELTDDALGVVGTPTALLSTDRPWETPLIEGPSMIAVGGTYHLFYSGNWYESPDYAVGHATCVRPTGPCKKSTVDQPLFKSSASVLGPGGQEFFDDGKGRTLMAYHGWSAPKASYALGGARSLHVAPITFASGVPTFNP